ncbi:MAG: helix-turn-helix domain-containing protein [Planctomycetota bacterium]
MLIMVGNAQQPAGHAFARGPGFSHWTIGLLRKGSARFQIGEVQVSVRAGEFAIIHPRTAYQVVLPNGGEESWAILSPPPSWGELLAWPETAPGCALVSGHGSHASRAHAAFREAEQWWAGGSPRRAALAMNAIERCLLLLANDRPGEAWADLHPGVRLVLAWLAPGPAAKVTIQELARRAGMSASHLAHTFTEQVGEAPLSWLEGRRIARAQQLLLTTDQPVKRIAQECGFADGEHLARRFRARIGCSPVAWRHRPIMA